MSITDNKLFILENDTALRLQLTRVFSVSNQVFSAESLKNARDHILNNFFDFVLLDKDLPDGSGVSIIQEIKTLSPETIIIIITGDSNFFPITEALQKGANDYIIKSPELIADLMLRMVISKKNQEIKNSKHILPQNITEITPQKYKEYIDSTNKEYIEKTIELFDNDLIQASKKLGIGRSTLFSKINQLGIKKPPHNEGGKC